MNSFNFILFAHRKHFINISVIISLLTICLPSKKLSYAWRKAFDLDISKLSTFNRFHVDSLVFSRCSMFREQFALLKCLLIILFLCLIALPPISGAMLKRAKWRIPFLFLTLIPHENGHSSTISPLSIWLDLNSGGKWIKNSKKVSLYYYLTGELSLRMYAPLVKCILGINHFDTMLSPSDQLKC